MIGRAVTVPANASSLTFDFDFLNVGDGDWLTVYFEERLLWSFTGTDFFGDSMHAVVDISDFAGEKGVLYLTLNSAGSRNADLLVSNIEFSSYSASIAVVPEPSTGARTFVALVMLILSSRKRRQAEYLWGTCAAGAPNSASQSPPRVAMPLQSNCHSRSSRFAAFPGATA